MKKDVAIIAGTRNNSNNKPISRCRFLSSEAMAAPSCHSTSATIRQQDIDQANQSHQGQVTIRKTHQKGWGVFSLRLFQPGERVVRASALMVLPQPDSHTIQTHWDRHVIMDLPATLFNHVCNKANIVARPNSMGAFDFHAIRLIQPNDELLFDYESTEYLLDHAFDCHCGDRHCRRRIRGFKFHKEQVIRAYGADNIAPYLLATT